MRLAHINLKEEAASCAAEHDLKMEVKSILGL